MRDRIDAILLASGFSSRFGNANKLLSDFRGKPLARHTLDLVCGLGCFNRIFFVAACNEVARLAERPGVTIIRNSNPDRGQRESVRLGVEASAGDYYMFFPCDQPLLGEDTIAQILENRRPGFIVQPRRREQPGNPALFSSAFRRELLALAPGARGRDIIQKHPDRVIPVELGDTLALIDIDYPELLEKYNGGGN
jgi:molybdenum cofactor cytidylyltransferase